MHGTTMKENKNYGLNI